MCPDDAHISYTGWEIGYEIVGLFVGVFKLPYH